MYIFPIQGTGIWLKHCSIYTAYSFGQYKCFDSSCSGVQPSRAQLVRPPGRRSPAGLGPMGPMGPHGLNIWAPWAPQGLWNNNNGRNQLDMKFEPYCCLFERVLHTRTASLVGTGIQLLSSFSGIHRHMTSIPRIAREGKIKV